MVCMHMCFSGDLGNTRGFSSSPPSVCARAMTEEPEAETAAKEPSGERK